MLRANAPTDIAACAAAVATSGVVIQLFPAGDFRAKDGRPQGLDAWHLTATAARNLVAAAAKRRTPYIIDYEHQTLLSNANGQPAPRAATFGTLEWRPGDGVYAIDVKWTARAKAYIDGDEYGHISPVFRFDPDTGDVMELLHVALTNDPALDSLPAVALSGRFAPTDAPTGEDTMTKAIRKALGLPDDADEATVVAAIAALKTKADATDASIATLKQRNDEIAALKSDTTTGKPDPAQYAPLSVVTALQADLAALKTDQTAGEVAALVQAGLDDGRLHSGMKKWASDLGKHDIAALKTYLDKAQPIAALTTSQTGGESPASDGKTALNASELAVCKAMGLKEDDYKTNIEVSH